MKSGPRLTSLLAHAKRSFAIYSPKSRLRGSYWQIWNSSAFAKLISLSSKKLNSLSTGLSAESPSGYCSLWRLGIPATARHAFSRRRKSGFKKPLHRYDLFTDFWLYGKLIFSRSTMVGTMIRPSRSAEEFLEHNYGFEAICQIGKNIQRFLEVNKKSLGNWFRTL